jgi:hypothetical protein
VIACHSTTNAEVGWTRVPLENSSSVPISIHLQNVSVRALVDDSQEVPAARLALASTDGVSSSPFVTGAFEERLDLRHLVKDSWFAVDWTNEGELGNILTPAQAISIDDAPALVSVVSRVVGFEYEQSSFGHYGVRPVGRWRCSKPEAAAAGTGRRRGAAV